MTNYHVTSLRVDQEQYNKFRELNVRTGVAFQDFVEQALIIYLSDPKFQMDVNRIVFQKQIQKKQDKKTKNLSPREDSSFVPSVPTPTIEEKEITQPPIEAFDKSTKKEQFSLIGLKWEGDNR